MIWENSPFPIPYPEALCRMEAHVDAMICRQEPEMIWCLEHPPLYTQGTHPSSLLDIKNPSLGLPFPIYPSGRGGRLTYHGPGQQVVYCMIDLKKQSSPPSINKYVNALQAWVVSVLRDIGVEGYSEPAMPGIWVKDPLNSKVSLKIASFGIRIRRWVTFHGFSLNLSPELSHFDAIVPCGNRAGVTSLKALGFPISHIDLNALFQKNCPFLQNNSLFKP